MKSLRSLALLAAAAVGLTVLTATVPAQAASVAVSDAQFRWGFNNESSNRAFNGGWNFFSAGKLGNPGAGGNDLKASADGATWSGGAAAGWKATEGNVRIEKKQSDNSYATATWAGTKTDKDGVALGNAASNTKFSDHQVVVDNGTGTLDAAANNANITWDGDFTVAYYSGSSFFYVSDPHLVVSNGTGTVTATLNGYGADQANPETWTTLSPASVTLATLSGVDVTDAGLVTTPAYLGVAYTGASSAGQSAPGSASYGSFPLSFVSFQEGVGTAAYWFSSGGSVDKNKPTLPLSVVVDPPPAKVVPNLGISAANSVYGKANVVTVAISSPGKTLSGSITLSGAGASTTKPLDPATGKVTFTLSKTLAPKAYTLKAVYSGNDQLATRTLTKAFTVVKAGAKASLKVVKKPTRTATGKATVTVSSLVAGVPVSGKATITLVKGTTKKVVTVTLRNGVATATLPKLTKGTWKISATYLGSATHNKATSAAATFAVR